MSVVVRVVVVDDERFHHSIGRFHESVGRICHIWQVETPKMSILVHAG